MLWMFGSSLLTIKSDVLQSFCKQMNTYIHKHAYLRKMTRLTHTSFALISLSWKLWNTKMYRLDRCGWESNTYMNKNKMRSSFVTRNTFLFLYTELGKRRGKFLNNFWKLVSRSISKRISLCQFPNTPILVYKYNEYEMKGFQWSLVTSNVFSKHNWILDIIVLNDHEETGESMLLDFHVHAREMFNALFFCLGLFIYYLPNIESPKPFAIIG